MADRTAAASRLAEVSDALAAHYTVKRVLGQGGMATVFLADRLSDGAAVAVKVLRQEFAASLLADRFQQEIRLLADLTHPNILPVLASEQAGAIVYYVMPFARHGSLRERIHASRPLPVDDVVAVTRDVAAALDHAHARGIVHRDIKPGNILFHEGRSVLCDFGVARAIVQAGGERLSTSGLVVGTPSYMSPEQARGAAVDKRGDIYALASVVYEMLVGEPPFTGRTTQVIMARQLKERPASIRVVRPEVPQCTEDAVFRALSKRPDDRPQSAGLFVEHLGTP